MKTNSNIHKERRVHRKLENLCESGDIHHRNYKGQHSAESSGTDGANKQVIHQRQILQTSDCKLISKQHIDSLVKKIKRLYLLMTQYVL